MAFFTSMTKQVSKQGLYWYQPNLQTLTNRLAQPGICVVEVQRCIEICQEESQVSTLIKTSIVKIKISEVMYTLYAKSKLILGVYRYNQAINQLFKSGSKDQPYDQQINKCAKKAWLSFRALKQCHSSVLEGDNQIIFDSILQDACK